MKNIFIVRHSNAEDPSELMDDFNRKLTEKGVKKAIKMAKVSESFFNNSSFCIFSSSAPRAIQTAQIFAENWNIQQEKIIQTESLYSYFLPEQIPQIINLHQISEENIWIFGHNPMCYDIANFLISNCMDGFPKCNIMGFELENDTFTMNSGKLICNLNPHDYAK